MNLNVTSAKVLQAIIEVIRDGFDLTQEQFAALLGISVRTLRNWEQGRRVPDEPARVLLQVAAKHS